MSRNGKVALIGVLFMAGLSLLLVGQVSGGGGWKLAVGVLCLIGAAALSQWQRRGAKNPGPLVGEYRGVLASEEGFVPLPGEAQGQQRAVQRRVVGKPEQAAESVRGLLADKVRQARPGRASSGGQQETGKGRKGSG